MPLFILCFEIKQGKGHLIFFVKLWTVQFVFFLCGHVLGNFQAEDRMSRLFFMK